MATPGTNGIHGTNDQVVNISRQAPRTDRIAKRPITQRGDEHIQKRISIAFFTPETCNEPDAANEKSNNEIRPIAAKNNH